MNLREYVHLLRRRWRNVAVVLLLFAGASVIITSASPRIYTANTQLFVSARDTSDSTNPNTAYQGSLFTQQRVKSYATVISSRRVALLVKQDLGLALSDETISRKVKATAPLDTVLLNVAVSDRDPQLAQRIAASVGKVFPAFVDDIEAQSTGGLSPVKVSVVQPAQLPTKPSSPRPKRNLALGLVLGLVGGVGLAVLREALDATVKSPDLARQLTGSPLLGAITFDPDAGKTPLVVIQHPNSPRAEAFRQLRTNLQFVDIEHRLRSVVFTSSVPGEGKSTTTCNLAITLAQAGLRVVLIEADLRRPRVADYMGVEGAVGLTSVLLGRVSLDDALQPWGDGGLEILTSGPLPPNPSELLGSAGMHDLLQDLEQRFDIAVFDAPPLLPVTDAAVLGTLCTGVVMLIRSNHTRREQVQRAAETLRAVSAPNLGTILNMVPTKGPDAYAYGYGYQYGYSAKGRPQLPRESDTLVSRFSTPTHSGGANDDQLEHARAATASSESSPTPAPPSPPQASVSAPPAVGSEAQLPRHDVDREQPEPTSDQGSWPTAWPAAEQRPPGLPDVPYFSDPSQEKPDARHRPQAEGP